ncbi:MAG: YihA family ribosome biogenesis GTP-binding protein [Hydrotalea flava]|uniref:ribosome biogenesis GTP-binding protein YihA/YsxC n=1 Tax=Hydrotalea TaxID=1004300 RepID=UPI001026819A|nr:MULTISPECIES: ribosome biogenesis GTP-binding protein YihA/YsxC [Hydrotalea]NIM34539.1 YihA family ribosome biogenesis GTP-binding protein [Hydrotalea flava]NIM37379.1 YihA family ribosome biogenesis GTP-binding protein [Hydrotalea flava]NIN02564.1 YihA family ribosome biogenesis GTP-binding protein [Hydrotalea flava]NIN14224.1 YihA family ribosome biogenesis GTP-binding protein [Hydrotalea flava]NIO93305.1 YihA family ribosome biogenesis GTP-binding protein [Hydrotalea flava]
MIIHTAKYLISSPSFDKCPPADKPEYAFIGRSNVGKSSLINMLTGQKSLAKTSATPGKTQLINHFLVESSTRQKQKQQWYVVDLPGYGYAKRSQTDRRRWEQMIENYLRKRPNLLQVMVLIDSRHAPQKNDLEFVNQLDKWEVPFSLIFTKADKEKPGVVSRNVQLFIDTLKSTWQFLPQVFITSAEKKTGREEVLLFIEQNNLRAAENEMIR